MNQPKVTFGIVNCNRLNYLKSCLESLMFCTETYDNKEIIIVDNASVEEGTLEYLSEKQSQGITVVRMDERDPSNEFARGLNTIFELSKGDYVCFLQGDMQFVTRGTWLEEYINYFEKHKEHIGCIALDAQRAVTIDSRKPYGVFEESDLNSSFRFFIDPKRPPIGGAGDAIYSREVLDKIYPWSVKNINHEGGNDSETEMLLKVEKLRKDGTLSNLHFISPQIPVSIAIWTDKRGTNARVRDNKRYGDYWPPKEDFRYYQIYELEDISTICTRESLPMPIEKLAVGVGWEVPKDEHGRWLKNPIRPETASDDDYEVLYDEVLSEPMFVENDSPDYLSDWLDND